MSSITTTITLYIGLTNHTLLWPNEHVQKDHVPYIWQIHIMINIQPYEEVFLFLTLLNLLERMKNQIRGQLWHLNRCSYQNWMTSKIINIETVTELKGRGEKVFGRFKCIRSKSTNSFWTILEQRSTRCSEIHSN